MPVDLLQTIKKDHEEFRSQLSQMKQTAETDPAQSQEVFKDLFKHLTAHHETEEALLFKRLVKEQQAKDPVEEGWEEHTAIDLYLQKVKAGHKSERWRAKVAVLDELVTHHLDEEETQVFPLLQQFFRSQLMELGKKFEEQEQKRMSK